MTKRTVVAFKLAAWFHDVVYFPGANNNEKLSANKFKIFANRINIKEDVISMVVEMIMATTHTKSEVLWFEQFICDADLKGLASDSFMENSINIKKECENISDELWRKNRGNFITHFLAKPFIYHTQLYKEKYEEKARANLKAELEYLTTL